MTRRPRGLTLYEAFAYYVPTGLPEDECWIWPLSKNNKGYGQLPFGGRPVLAHRVSWEIANGRPAPPKEKVRHTCDNPPCVNPRHLILGTSKQNSEDMVERGRSPLGERNGRAVLTEAQVIEAHQLRAQGVQYPILAQRYGVGTPTIWVAINKAWPHLRETELSEDQVLAGE